MWRLSKDRSSSGQKAPFVSPQHSLWICFAPDKYLNHEISGALNFIDCFYDFRLRCYYIDGL